LHRDRFRWVPLFLAVLVISGCGSDERPADEPGLTGGWSTAGCELAHVPEHVTIGGLRMPATPAKLDSVMARIDQEGRSRFAESFAGLEVDQEQVRAYVYRVPSATFDDFIRDSAEDVCIVVRDAAHAATELTYWHDRVVADLGYWKHEGIHIATIGALHDGSGVEVGTPDLDRARPALSARYGPEAPLIFRSQGPVQPLTSSPAR
jgi:hypothetical protein